MYYSYMYPQVQFHVEKLTMGMIIKLNKNLLFDTEFLELYW